MRVRAIREELRLKQQEFAERLGRPGSQSVVSEIERGAREPEPTILLDIAALAGKGVEHFQAVPDAGEAERRDKLTVLRWLEAQAAAIRAEVEVTPAASNGQAIPEVVEAFGVAGDRPPDPSQPAPRDPEKTQEEGESRPDTPPKRRGRQR